MKFDHLGLAEPILRAIAADGYHTPTPIQAKAIPVVLEGHDLLGCAQTGTGKTAAFALPMLHRMATTPDASQPAPTPADEHNHHHKPNHHQGNGRKRHHDQPKRPIRALVLCPTRELASQIADSFKAYGRNLALRHAVIFGGVSQFHQVRALTNGVDILIATPGRLLDLMQQGHVNLASVQTFVLDEADRMLDMGFIPDIRRIVKHIPTKRQTLLFSATMPNDIRKLADSILHNPVSVQVNPVSSTVETIAQSVYFVPRPSKPALLSHLLRSGRDAGTMMRTLVFTRTKRGADKVVRHLSKSGIRAEAIHGNKSQNARTRAMSAFKSKNPPVLVATDIASRGIDVDEVTHVINYDMPDVPETYVHRIGRTARAGASGSAITFCDHEERGDFKAIERLTRANITVVRDLPRLEISPMDSAASSSEHYERREHRGHQPRSNNGGQHKHAHVSSKPRHSGGDKHHSKSRSHHAGEAAHAPGKSAHHHKHGHGHTHVGDSQHAHRGHGHSQTKSQPQGFGQRGRGRKRGSGKAW